MACNSERPIMSSRYVAGLALGLSLLTSGCIVVPADPSPVRASGPQVIYTQPGYVNVPPPPPQPEYVGPPPVAGYVWITGFWAWQLGRHVWMGGHWEAPPRSGARWAPHYWDRGQGGWRLHDGHWH
jgi:hypothetical protein